MPPLLPGQRESKGVGKPPQLRKAAGRPRPRLKGPSLPKETAVTSGSGPFPGPAMQWGWGLGGLKAANIHASAPTMESSPPPNSVEPPDALLGSQARCFLTRIAPFQDPGAQCERWHCLPILPAPQVLHWAAKQKHAEFQGSSPCRAHSEEELGSAHQARMPTDFSG